MNFRPIIKSLIPPFLLTAITFFKKRKYSSDLLWKGNFNSWINAKQSCTGYDSQNILEKCKTSLLQVKNGNAVYERDSVIFDKIQYSWPLITALQHIALENNHSLNVIDLGGALGSTYYQNLFFLITIKEVKWHIIEQSNFVECGKKYFETNALRFHKSWADIDQKTEVNCVLLSSILQYIDDPDQLISKILDDNFPFIIIDRTSFINDEQRLTIQTVPEWIYNASYPCWFFNEEDFLSFFKEKYDLVSDFSSFADSEQQSEDGKRMYWKGFFFKLKK